MSVVALLAIACSKPKPPPIAAPTRIEPGTITVPRTFLSQSKELPLVFNLNGETLWGARLTLIPSGTPEGVFRISPEGPLHIPAFLTYTPTREGTDHARLLIEWKGALFLVEVEGIAAAVPSCSAPDQCTRGRFSFESESCVLEPDNEGARCMDAACPDVAVCKAGACTTISATPTPYGRCDDHPDAEITLSPTWTVPLGWAGLSQLALDDAGNLYLYSVRSDRLYELLSVDSTGQIRWRHELPDDTPSRFFVAGDYIALMMWRGLQVLSTADGSVVWRERFAAPGTPAGLDTMLTPDVVLGHHMDGDQTTFLTRELATGEVLRTLLISPNDSGKALEFGSVIGDGHGQAYASTFASYFASSGTEFAVNAQLQVLWSNTRSELSDQSWAPLLSVGDTYWNLRNEVVATRSGEHLGELDWLDIPLRSRPITGGDGRVHHVGLVSYRYSSNGPRCSVDVLYSTDPSTMSRVSACYLQSDEFSPSLLATKEGLAVLDHHAATQTHTRVLLLRGPRAASLVAHLLPDDAIPISGAGMVAHGQRVFVALTGDRTGRLLAAYDVPGLEVATEGWICDGGNQGRTGSPLLTSRPAALK